MKDVFAWLGWILLIIFLVILLEDDENICTMTERVVGDPVWEVCEE